jgi:hypothetical protein
MMTARSRTGRVINKQPQCQLRKETKFYMLGKSACPTTTGQLDLAHVTNMRATITQKQF